MRLVLNGINGEYLRDITHAALGETESVDAAVAYATKSELLFDWCWTNGIPLRFWGRFDSGVPVSIPVLDKFLRRRSPNFTCKLVRRFHPKVIWWHGYGAYVGSANITDSAWHGNVEAGCFFEEAELIANGLDVQLTSFFAEIDRHASPLGDELFRLLEARSRQLGRIETQDRDAAAALLATGTVQPWAGLLQTSKSSAANREHTEFLREWHSTLTILRNLSSKLQGAENRPAWVGEDIPAGAHVDQLLHAHYYHRVIEGNRSMYEAHYADTKGDPAAAELEAIRWWRGLRAAPSNEDRMLNEWAPFLRNELSESRIRSLNEEDLFQVFSRVHAISDHARRIANKDVGLPGGVNYTIPQKTRALAKFAWNARSDKGRTVIDLLEHVLYGGHVDKVPDRIWEGLKDPTWRIDHIGKSALGELVGWALPDNFPPRNSRTSKALRSLGHDIQV